MPYPYCWADAPVPSGSGYLAEGTRIMRTEWQAITRLDHIHVKRIVAERIKTHDI